MPYVVRPADLTADRDAILAVWEDSLPGATAAHYTWVYENNPFGPVSSWVVEADARQVVGVATVMPRALYGMGRGWRGGITIDFAVARGHRTGGPALMLQKAVLRACAERFEIVYGFPVHAAAVVQARAGFTTLGKATEVKKTLRTADALASRYGNVAMLAAPVVDAALRLREHAALRGAHGRGHFAETATFDARFDEFWTRVRDRLPLTGERTSTFLDWRYTRCPHAAYRAVVMQRAGSDRLAGYAVWSVRDRDFIIADFLTEDPGDGAVALMAKVMACARALGAAAVRMRCFGAAQLAATQRRLGFRTGQSGRDAVLFVPHGNGTAATCADGANWYLLHGDTDV